MIKTIPSCFNNSKKNKKPELKDQQKADKDAMKAAMGSTGDCDEEMGFRRRL